MKINIGRIWILVILFVFLYDPPILRYSLLLHMLCVISLIVLVKSNRNTIIFVNMLVNTKIWIFSAILLIISLYLVIYDCVSSSANVAYGRIYIYAVIAIEFVVIAYYFALYYRKSNSKLEDFLKDILIIGNIQGGIGFIAFLNPAIKEFLVGVMYANGVDKINAYLLSVRFYGFAHYLTSTTAIIQSVLAVIALWMALEYSNKYFIYVPLLLFSSVLNARSSLIIIASGVILIAIYKVNFKNKKMWKELLLISVLVFLFARFVLPQLRLLESWTWIQSGIDEISAFLQGDEIGYFEYLKNSIFLPEKTYQLLLGTGHAIFRGSIVSDVGYLNDIWMIGIILTGCLYIFFIRVIMNDYRKHAKSVRFIQIFLVATFLIYNIKGIVIGNNEIVRFCILMTVVVYFLSTNNKSEESKDLSASLKSKEIC